MQHVHLDSSNADSADLALVSLPAGLPVFSLETLQDKNLLDSLVLPATNLLIT